MNTAPAINPWDRLTFQPWNAVREAALASQVQRLAPPPLELKPENWRRPVSTKPIRLPDRFKQLVIHFSQVHAEFTVADFRAADPSLADGSLYNILNKATRLGILVKRHPVAHTGCPQKYRLAKAPGGAQ